MLTYIVTYLLVLFASYCISRSDNSYLSDNGHMIRSSGTKFIFVIAVAIMIFVAGCRYRVGADYGVYYSGYSNYGKNFFLHLKRLEEPGRDLIFKVGNAIKDDPAMGIFLCAAVTICLLQSVYYKYSENLSLSLILYVFVIWHTCFNGIRQALAVAVFFTAYNALKYKKFKQFLLISFLSFLFHRSVLPMIVVYFLVNQKVTTKNVLLVLAGTIVLLYSYTRIYLFMGVVMDKEDYFALYSESSSNYLSRSVNILRVLFETFPAAFFLYKRRELAIEHDVQNIDFNINLLIVHAAVAIATSGSAYMARMSQFTMPFAVIAVSNLLTQFKRNRRLYYLLFVVMFMFFGIYEVRHSGRLIPFHWIWER